MAITRNSSGIKDIARALKVSIGTVDRALHGRPGVSDKTKARVMKMAEQLGYQPNLAARALKLNRSYAIAAILPKHIAHFFEPLRAGIQTAAERTVSVNLTLDFHEYPRVGTGDLQAVESAVRRHYDGLILVPANTRDFDQLIHRVTRAGTAVVCVGSDAPNSGRAGSVTVHAAVSGAIAAELLAQTLPEPAAVAIMTGALSTLDHTEKLRGFAATLAVHAPHLRLLPALESHERPREAYQQAKMLMQGKSRPEGLYLSTANSVPVLQVLDELRLLGKVRVVATDLFEELVPLVESGKVLATLFQRPFAQGKLAFETLLRSLLDGNSAQADIRLAPHIVLRSNLSLFSRQIAHTEDEAELDALPRLPTRLN